MGYRLEPVNARGVLTELGDDFCRVVDRIVNELDDQSIDCLDRERLAGVEVAERTVDARARELQRGLCGTGEWKAALADYEAHWVKILSGLGERRNWAEGAGSAG